MQHILRNILALAALVLFLGSEQKLWSQQPRQQRLPENTTVQSDIEYGKAGDIGLKLDLYLPRAESKQPRPVLVWIHGGGWQNGNKNGGGRRLAPLLAGGEYVGVSVGYRLTDKTPWPGQIHDCKAAIRWIRANAKKYNLDPNKIGVWGSSAGGHLVSMLGTSGDVKELEGNNGSPDQSSRVACVVDFCGPSDFIAFGKDNPSMNRPTSAVGKLLGGALKDKQDVAKSASPVTHISKDDPPFLVVHGTNDKLVPLSQAELFHTALQKAGVNSTFVRIEGGGHGIGGDEVNKRVRAFFDKHLLGKNVTVSGEAIRQ